MSHQSDSPCRSVPVRPNDVFMMVDYQGTVEVEAALRALLADRDHLDYEVTFKKRTLTPHTSSHTPTEPQLSPPTSNSRSQLKMAQPQVRLTPNGYEYGPAPHSAKPSASADSGKDGQVAPFPNPRAEGYHEYLPQQPYPIGSLLPAEKFKQNAKPPKLFDALTIRGVEFPNRAWVSPMCQCEYLY